MLLDIITNVFSSLILVGIIQIIVFPMLSRTEGSSILGSIASIYGINNVISIAFGNTLNNVRLLNRKNSGFQLLAILLSFFAVLLSLILYNVYGSGQSRLNIALIALFSGLVNYRTYACVEYRLNLEYIKQLYMNLWVSVGYIVGIVFYFKFNLWSGIFLCGEIFGYIYLVKSTDVFNEKINVNNDFKFIFNEFRNLSLANLVSSSLNYLDRFLILPILGPTSMATFFSTSVSAKIFNLIVSPATNVILSYLTKSKNKFNKKSFFVLNGLQLILLVPLVLILIFITNILVKLLYPSVFSEAHNIIFFISIGIACNLMYSISNPIILRYFPLRVQLTVQLIFGIIYITAAVAMSIKFGLIGFCYAFAGSYTLKWVLQICLASVSKVKNF